MNDVETANDARRRKSLIAAIKSALAPGRSLAGGVGEALGIVVAELLGSAERIAKLEAQLAGQQKRIDHAAKGLHFLGEWQAAAAYAAGAVVRHRGAAYTALRDVLPGKAEPGRQGSGWDRLL